MSPKDRTVSNVAAALCFALAAAGAAAAGAAYPERPVRYIVPSAPGGSPDITARLLTAELSRRTGQQFVVDNRVGASGIIGTDMIAKATPDGYTIGQGLAPAMAVMRSLVPKLPYDPDRDFQPLVHYYYTPNLLAVTPSLPVTSVRELIDRARNHPGSMLYGSSGNGTTFHLGAELLQLMTGTRMVHVPYKAVQAAMSDLIAARLHFMFNTVSSIEPHVKSGRLRGLAVTSLTRSVTFPDLPTVSEAGVPGFEVVSWAGIIAPARTPSAVVAILNSQINQALADPTLRDKLVSLGYGVVGGSAAQFAEHVRKESVKWADVVRRAHVKAQ